MAVENTTDNMSNPPRDFHRYRYRIRGDDKTAFYIGSIPGRKRLALMYTAPGYIWPMAYFISDEAANAFLDKWEGTP